MKSTIRLALALAVAAFAAPALAQTATTAFDVTATVRTTCQLQNALPLAFSGGGTTYDTMGAALDGSTTFELRCNRGTAYTIAVGDGSNFGAATGYATERAMRGDTVAAHFLAYQLFQNAGRTVPWGGTVGVNTLAGNAANSAWTPIPIYGRIPSGQTEASAQTYTDGTVTITVSF